MPRLSLLVKPGPEPIGVASPPWWRLQRGRLAGRVQADTVELLGSVALVLHLWQGPPPWGGSGERRGHRMMPLAASD